MLMVIENHRKNQNNYKTDLFKLNEMHLLKI
jgi:hypothetical protein